MKFSIYRKLLSSFVLIIVLMVAANVYVLWQLHEVTTTTSLTFRNDVRSINLAKQLQVVLDDEEQYAEKYLIRRDSSYLPLFSQQAGLFNQLADSMYDAMPSATEIDLLFRLRTGHRWFVENLESEITKHARGGRGIVSLSHEHLDSLGVMHELVDKIIRLNELEVSNSVSGISEAMVRSSNVAWLITVGALLVALTVALVITRTLVQPIRTLIRGTENIARGIFDPIEVKSRDEMAWLARAVNEMSSRLKQINDLKTEMLHHISHELRTPLQTMLSAQYLLAEQKRGPLNEEQKRLVSSIKEGIRKLTVFSNQFLDIQKIEHGAMEYAFDRMNLLETITPTVDDATLVGAEKEISVSFTHEADLPDIKGDAEKIPQVFSNLLSNAIKYTEPGGTIRVHVAKHKKGIRTTVSDSGAGISREDVPRIFTKFYQAKNAKKGTGIGLALVKHLVEAHKGKISVESELGKGTTFTVDLPAMTSAAKSHTAPSRIKEETA
ncbi:MAG: HAMP domain-containing protein [Bacteroidetes bacterium]|nr:HAMP domain-containing protein [Bacteroidota bacterium]MCW5896685.1 HAMP domain-containing protein [Bacteroidota bacterium]